MLVQCLSTTTDRQATTDNNINFIIANVVVLQVCGVFFEGALLAIGTTMGRSKYR